jgi:hypothetical protein
MERAFVEFTPVWPVQLKCGSIVITGQDQALSLGQQERGADPPHVFVSTAYSLH